MIFSDMADKSNAMLIALDNCRFFLHGDWPDENGRYLETMLSEKQESFCRNMQKNSIRLQEEHDQNIRMHEMILNRMRELADSLFEFKGVLEETYIQHNGFQMSQRQNASDVSKNSESNQKLLEQFQICTQGDEE